MAKIDLAAEKWARKMARAGPKWKSGVTGKESAFCRGVAEFIGVGTCDPAVSSAYAQGVGAVSAEEFQSAVAGKETKWKQKYIEAMT